MRYKIIISYIGTEFVGWQHQVGGGSVQDLVEDALFRLSGERVSVFASGRTDAGVHALGQVAHFDLVKHFEPCKIAAGLNFYLPFSVRVLAAEVVGSDFHARKSAKQKTYIYLMYKSKMDHALLLGRALKISPDADIDKMRQAAAHFVGRHDFFAFMSAGSSAKTSTRTIFESQIELVDNGVTPPQIVYRVTADGFLYNMVRKIVAHILKAGIGKLNPDQIPDLITQKDRTKTKDVARPDGLYLHSVKYNH